MPNQPSRLGVHRPFALWDVVVMTEQVENPVSQEEPHLGEQGTMPRRRLATRRVHRDYDVTQASRAICPRFEVEREGQNVRRAILVAMAQIQAVDHAVVGQKHAELRALEPERVEHLLRELAHQADGQFRSARRAAENECRHEDLAFSTTARVLAWLIFLKTACGTQFRVARGPRETGKPPLLDRSSAS
jgi:hypothetical protein